MDERTEKLRRKLIFKEDRIQRLTEENQRYKEALEFYASKESWERDDPFEPLSCPAMRDIGEKARQELKGESE